MMGAGGAGLSPVLCFSVEMDGGAGLRAIFPVPWKTEEGD
jgi:hypothetical protein